MQTPLQNPDIYNGKVGGVHGWAHLVKNCRHFGGEFSRVIYARTLLPIFCLVRQH